MDRLLQAKVAFDAESLQAAAAGGAPPIPTFQLEAYTGGKMQPPGFKYPIVVDLDDLQCAEQVPVFLDHEVSGRGLVGHASTSIKAGRLVAEGMVSAGTESAEMVVTSAKRGFPWQVSIGGSVRSKTFVQAGKAVHINGRTQQGPLFHVKAHVQELSFVPLGADSNTSAAIAAMATSRKGESLMPATKTPEGSQAAENPTAAQPKIEPEFRDWISAQSINPDELDREEIGTLKAAYDLDVERQVAEESKNTQKQLLASMRDVTSAELKRQAKIRDLTKHDMDMQAKAIEEGWTPEHTELEQFRQEMRIRPRGNGSSGSRNLNGRVIEAAICSQTGMDMGWLDQKSDHWRDPIFATRTRGYTEQELDMASDMSEYSFSRLFHEFLYCNGVSVGPGTTVAELIPKVKDCHRQLRASTGFSGVDLSGIMSNVMHKSLLNAFEGVRPVAQRISSTRNVSDFKQSSAYRMTGNGDFLPLNPAGELESMQLQEETYTAKAETYGRMLSVPRQLLVNDDLGALNAVTQILGRKAALGLQKQFFTLWLTLEATNVFAVANNNLVGLNPLGIPGLTAAETAFLNQVDADGDPIDVEPQTLLVPAALKVTAETLMNSTATMMFAHGALGVDQVTGVQIPEMNPHVGKWNIEWTQWLSNATIPNNSATSWYLVAPPSVAAIAEIVYLNGRRAPVIESEDADFATLGFQWRAYFDFGVAAQDFRGAVKSNIV